MKSDKHIHYAETAHGFEYGSAKVSRMFSDEKKGWVTIGIETPKQSGNDGLQVYITKTGNIRIFDKHGEWERPDPLSIARVKCRCKKDYGDRFDRTEPMAYICNKCGGEK